MLKFSTTREGVQSRPSEVQYRQIYLDIWRWLLGDEFHIERLRLPRPIFWLTSTGKAVVLPSADLLARPLLTRRLILRRKARKSHASQLDDEVVVVVDFGDPLMLLEAIDIQPSLYIQ